MGRIVAVLMTLVFVFQDLDQASAQSKRSIFGIRSSTKTNNIFGVRRKPNFFAISSAGRLPHKLTQRSFKILRVNNARLYGQKGIRNNYFGKR
jgi:hypothetical protein